MTVHLKAIGRKIWSVSEEVFVVLDPKHLTPIDEEKLQLNDQAMKVLYEAHDQ